MIHPQLWKHVPFHIFITLHSAHLHGTPIFYWEEEMNQASDKKFEQHQQAVLTIKWELSSKAARPEPANS